MSAITGCLILNFDKFARNGTRVKAITPKTAISSIKTFAPELGSIGKRKGNVKIKSKIWPKKPDILSSATAFVVVDRLMSFFFERCIILNASPPKNDKAV